MSMQAATAPQTTDDATCNAYNSTFAAMELDWHWDRETYTRLRADGDERQALRTYVQQHRPHLLRAYGVDCLIDAIESTRRALSR